MYICRGTTGGAKEGSGGSSGETHPTGPSKGIGFARLDSHEKCERLIERYGGKVIPGASEPLVVKLADANKNRRFGPNANSPNSSSSSGSCSSSNNNNLQSLAGFGALGGLALGNGLGGGMLQDAALAAALGLGVGVGVQNGGVGALGPLLNQESLKTAALTLLLQQQQQPSPVQVDPAANANAASLLQLLQQQQQQQHTQQQAQGVNANQLLNEAALGQLLAQPGAAAANLQQLNQLNAAYLARQQQQQQQQAALLQLQALMGAQAHAPAVAHLQAHTAQGAAPPTAAALDAQQSLLYPLQSIAALQHLPFSIAEVCERFILIER